MDTKKKTGNIRKIFLSTLILVLSILSGYSQESVSDANFYNLQKKFYSQYAQKENRPPYEHKFRDGEYERFKRFEWFMEPRVSSSGEFNAGALWEEWSRYNAHRKLNRTNQIVSNWSLIGPVAIPAGGCAGRLNCIEIDPSNSNVIYVGAANGGLWKSTNGGNSWSTATDNIPTLSISDIAVDPSNSNTIYIATGDGSGYDVGGDFWGGAYSAGVLKSTDGGATWNTTGLTYSQNQKKIIHRIVVSPSNPQLLFASTSTGLWKSTNGGTSWTAAISSGHFYDIEFQPGNPNTIYTGSDLGTVKRSIDSGSSFSNIGQFSSQPGKVSIAVTPADANYIYVWVEPNIFKKSINGGTTFTTVTSPAATNSSYGYYDMPLGVSPTNANIVYAGGLNIAKSTDGGSTWNIVGDWAANTTDPNYVHADHHDFAFIPGNGSTVFSCNDGGIFKSTTSGGTWSDLSSGLSIAQYYRFGCSASNSSIMYAGQQDQGVMRKSGGTWEMKFFGDGTECAVVRTDNNIVYSSIIYGQLHRSSDAGNTFTEITPSIGGGWVTPFEIHPSNPQLIFAAYEEVYKSNDGGEFSWTPISNIASGSSLYSFAAAPSNVNYLYAGTLQDIWRTTNGGSTWTNIALGLPVTSNIISYITVSATDPQKVWVTISGYTFGNKVFQSINGGTSWTNISGSLPNVPANCITYHNGSPDGLYIGTDMGVFYRDNTMSDWTPFDTGLPHVIVNELEIFYPTNKIRAATYGRGIWESNTSYDVGINENDVQFSISVYPNPSGGNITVDVSGSVHFTSLKITNLLGETVREQKIAAPKTTISLSSQPNGVYFVQLRNDKETVTKKILLNR